MRAHPSGLHRPSDGTHLLPHLPGLSVGPRCVNGKAGQTGAQRVLIILSPGQRKEIPLCHLLQARDSHNFLVNTVLTLLWCISSASNQYGSERLRKLFSLKGAIQCSPVIEMTGLRASTTFCTHHIIYIYIYMYVYMCVYIYIHMYMYVYMCVYIYICMYVCMYVYMIWYVGYSGWTQKSEIFKFSYHIFTYCPFCISSPASYKKGKDFYFSNFEKEKCFHFLSCEERKGFSFCNFLPITAVWAWVSKGLVNTIQLLKCFFV